MFYIVYWFGGFNVFNEKSAKNIEKIETLVGEQCSIVGNLNGGGLLKIDGSIEGTISWQDDIILGALAMQNGNISCRNIFIAGKVTGNILCGEGLTIASTGRLTGDINVKHLIIHEGGYFNGNCIMNHE
jgi:cytoskeletal protein CcmA (bactofilin family)